MLSLTLTQIHDINMLLRAPEHSSKQCFSKSNQKLLKYSRNHVQKLLGRLSKLRSPHLPAGEKIFYLVLGSFGDFLHQRKKKHVYKLFGIIKRKHKVCTQQHLYRFHWSLI